MLPCHGPSQSVFRTDFYSLKKIWEEQGGRNQVLSQAGGTSSCAWREESARVQVIPRGFRWHGGSLVGARGAIDIGERLMAWWVTRVAAEQGQLHGVSLRVVRHVGSRGNGWQTIAPERTSLQWCTCTHSTCLWQTIAPVYPGRIADDRPKADEYTPEQRQLNSPGSDAWPWRKFYVMADKLGFTEESQRIMCAQCTGLRT